jgi:hypothetical protein
MGRKPLHNRAIKFIVIMVDLGYQCAYIRSYGNVVGILEERSFRRHWPRRPSGANIWKSLLHTNRSVRSLHDEYEIEVAIANLADFPNVGPTTEKHANVFEVSK